MLDRYDRGGATDGREAARLAGLVYVVPYRNAGIRRRKVGKGFTYDDPRGARVRDDATLARIRSLVIPPAWVDVWIAFDPDGHIQAAGRDARGRLQYRYHPRWSELRTTAKYGRLAEFCGRLPRLRTRVARDLACGCVCRDQVAATVVALLERGHLRVGNDEYTKQNGTYGATTLESRHLKLRGARIVLAYKGKSGIDRKIELADPVLAKVIARIQALPGKRLFQYVDRERGGKRPRPITSNDVNAYLRAALGPTFSAKDFRTWAATVRCALRLAACETPTSQAALKRAVAGVIKDVAARLGHTPTVCRKSYVHPVVLEAFAAGELADFFPARLRKRAECGFDVAVLRAAEKGLATLLARRAAAQGRARSAPRRTKPSRASAAGAARVTPATLGTGSAASAPPSS